MPDANCSIFGCPVSRRKEYRGISLFKVPAGKNYFDKNWRTRLVAVITEDRVVDASLRTQIERNYFYGVMMGSPLGALFANVFMTELENTLIPKLTDKRSNWTRYVDDTFPFVTPGSEATIQNELNSYHNSIKFTYEVEKTNKLPFLDILITKTTDGKLETSVYRKTTNTDIYI